MHAKLCRLVLQNKAFLLKNRFRSYVCGFSTQVNYYSTAHKWHRKSFTNHFARKQLLRKPPDTTILDTFAMLKRFFKKRVMTTPVLYYACFLVSLFCCRVKAAPPHRGVKTPPQNLHSPRSSIWHFYTQNDWGQISAPPCTGRH